ncbi:hypothetical protein SLA2020_290140 [Shorea laevis]
MNKTGKKKETGHTRVLVGVEMVKIVALFAQLNARRSSTGLLHQKRVVLLHYLPNQGPRCCRHCLGLLCTFTSLDFTQNTNPGSGKSPTREANFYIEFTESKGGRQECLRPLHGIGLIAVLLTDA